MTLDASDIRKLFEQRMQFPIGATHDNQNEEDYIAERLAAEGKRKFLLLPANAIIGSRKIKVAGSTDTQTVREALLANHHLTHFAELGAIWKPATHVPFVLIGLSDGSEEKIALLEAEDIAAAMPLDGRRDTGQLGNLVIEEAKCQALANWLNGQDIGLPAIRSFSIRSGAFDPEHFQVRYYAPDLIDAVDEVTSKDHLSLKDVADILKPCPLREEQGRILGVRHFKYPIQIEELQIARKNNVELQPGDVLLSNVGEHKRAGFIFDRVLDEPIYASGHTFVIRIKDERFTPEYVCLFLLSDVGRKFAERHATGTVVRMLNRRSLDNFPIVVPEKETLQRAKQLFDVMYRKSEDHEPSGIYEQLFQDVKPSSSPIEAEFLIEQLGKVRRWKDSLIREIVEADLREIEACARHKAFKSAIILCGSVLEAILLDWLSELDQHDYVGSKKDLRLFDMITRFSEQGVLEERLVENANFIRSQRNLVHPKKLLGSDKIKEADCKNSISALKAIIHERFENASGGTA